MLRLDCSSFCDDDDCGIDDESLHSSLWIEGGETGDENPGRSNLKFVDWEFDRILKFSFDNNWLVDLVICDRLCFGGLKIGWFSENVWSFNGSVISSAKLRVSFERNEVKILPIPHAEHK